MKNQSGSRAKSETKAQVAQLRLLLSLMISVSFFGTARSASADLGDMLSHPIDSGNPISSPDFAEEEYRREQALRRKRKLEEDEREIESRKENKKMRDANQASENDKGGDRKDRDIMHSESDDFWQPDRDKDKSYSGSQFNAEDYMDSNFNQHSFTDLLESSAHPAPEPDMDFDIKKLLFKDSGEENGMDAVDKEKFKVGDKDKKDDDSGDDHSPKTSRFHVNEFNQIFEPGTYHLEDWAPSKPDKTANGGFGIEDDNGRPVPYKLNGHVKIERGYPWEKNN